MAWGGEPGVRGLLRDQVEVERQGSARGWAQGNSDLLSWGSQSEEDLWEVAREVVVLAALIER